MPWSTWTAMITAVFCGKKAKTPNRAAWPRIPRIIVVFQPSFASTLPRNAIVTISATWPMLITGMIHSGLIPTAGLPRKSPAITK